MVMKRYFLGLALLLALAGCASQAPRCGGRLAPINRPWMPGDPHSDPRSAAAHSVKASRS
jgi:hypothetical protein